MASNAEPTQTVQPQLGLWDAVSIIIGIVIGSSIYVIPSIINGHLSSPTEVMVIWTIGGVLCLIGALCYAELGTAYPRMGGDYVYLTKAFGPWFGFQFGWAQLAVILTASIGMMGFVFGDYAVKLLGLSESGAAAAIKVTLAVLAVGGLTAINIMGVVMGKHTQNVLSLTKVIGLGGIVVAGLVYGKPESAWVASKATESLPSYGTALILVLYAYGGWNDAAFVAAEMRHKRHIPTTLLLGTGGVMVIYLLINAAYIQALGFKDTQGFHPSPIAARSAGTLGEWAAKSISLLVMISALGAINGLLFTGSRVCSALGNEYRVFASLGQWHPKLGSPVWSLTAMAGISIAMILGVGTETGQHLIDDALGTAAIGPMPWQKYFGGFDTLFAGTAPVFWFFFLLTGLALFVLRENDKETKRPFKVPLYPYLPTIFCAMCLFGLYSALAYAGLVSLIGIVPLLIGVPLYAVSRYRPQLVEGEKPAAAPKAETPPWLAEQPAAPPLQEPPAAPPLQEPPTVEERIPPTPNEPVVTAPPPVPESAEPPVPAAVPPAAEEPPAEDNPFSFRK